MNSPLSDAQPSPPPALQAEAILESITDAFFAVDRYWRVTYVNREAERVLEKPRSQMLGRSLWSSFPEGAGTVFHRQFSRALATGEPVQFEEFYPPLQRWFEVRAYPAENHLTIYFHDTTHRRKAEEGLRLSRERLDLVLQSVDVGLWYCDLPFDELVWNDRTKDHFWLPADAHVTIDTFFERLHPDDRERIRNEIQRAIAEQRTYDTEYRTMAPDGRIKWIRAIGRSFYGADGRPVRFDGVTVDISAQKALLATEQQSRAEAEMLNTVGRALSAELDLEQLVQMITNAATELTSAEFGAFFYNVRDERGESYTLFTLAGVPREAFTKFPMPRNTCVFAPTFRGEGVVRSDDITSDARYGKNPPYNGMPAGHLPVRSYLAVPVVSRSGRVIGGLFLGHAKAGVFTDKHERIAISLASQAATAMDNAYLFTTAERARQEAQDNAKALAKSNAELQQVAYVAAHDLQEPLRTIASFTQLVERRYRNIAGGQADELVDGIVGAVRRMQVLLNDLLEYTTLSSDEARPQGPVDMAQIYRECVDELGPIILEKQARLLTDPLPVVSPGNRSHLKILLSNILTNALKYSRPGIPPEITIRFQRDDGSCAFSVRDNGQGFAPEYSKQIFGMFKRLHGRDVPGTGIGLALCRRIVEVHGGSIWAEAEPDRGATIFFTLPCESSPA